MGVRVTETVDRIEEFPKDGRLWWVRWVDSYHIPHRGTATPWVEVLLSPLNASLSEVRNLKFKHVAASSGTLRPIRLFTGYIPRLALGTVFLDGVEVACLPLKHARFDIKDVRTSIHGVLDELSTKPSWWNPTFPYRVINRRDYHLGPSLKSNAIVVETGYVVLVIPCYEIFRSMYAPDSEVARALTSGPWEFTMEKVIDPEGTGIRADGRWQITLRTKTRNDYAHVLANLCLSTAGREGAYGIYTALLRDDGPGYMRVPFPFELSHLELEVRGLWLDGDPRKFLALQVTGMVWPLDKEIVYYRKNSSDKGDVQTRIDKPKPYSSRGARPNCDADGFVDANSQEDPSASSAVTNFRVPSIHWHNAPQLQKEPKAESFIYTGVHGNVGDRALGGVSAGTEWHGETSSGSAAYSLERRDASHRFTDVAQMLDRLQSSGAISGWFPVPHPKPKLYVEDMPVWHFPRRAAGMKKTLGYSYIDRKEGRLRGALVCQIQYDGHFVYWFEIEMSPRASGCKSLIFTVPRPNPTGTIFRILEIAALSRGVWPSSDEMILDAGVSWAEFWVHSYIGKNATQHGGRLNEVRALQAIARAANNGSQTQIEHPDVGTIGWTTHTMTRTASPERTAGASNNR